MTYQGSTIAALVTDRNTWQTRANNAWGSSRVWNSGTSWEAAYGTANTNANNAWGPSRVYGSGNSWEYLTGYHGWISRGYNSGESWEAAYNRVYTDRYNEGYNAAIAASYARVGTMTLTGTNILTYSPGTPIDLQWAETSDPYGLFSASGASITLANGGTYQVYAMAATGSNQWAGNSGFHLEILRNGSGVGNLANPQTAGGVDGFTARSHVAMRFACNAGDVITIRAVRDGGGYDYSFGSGYCEVMRLPLI